MAAAVSSLPAAALHQRAALQKVASLQICARSRKLGQQKSRPQMANRDLDVEVEPSGLEPLTPCFLVCGCYSACQPGSDAPLGHGPPCPDQAGARAGLVDREQVGKVKLSRRFADGSTSSVTLDIHWGPRCGTAVLSAMAAPQPRAWPAAPCPHQRQPRRTADDDRSSSSAQPGVSGLSTVVARALRTECQKLA
jgi:hypothetical protein